MFDRVPCMRILVAALLVTSAAACSQPGAGTSGPGATGPGTTAGTATTAQPQGSAGGIGTTPAACDLLTNAQVEGVTGHTVQSKDAARADVAFRNHCVWLFEIPSWMLVLGIEAPGAIEYTRQWQFEGGTAVSGFSDAFMGAASDALFVLHRDTLIFIQVVAVGEADNVEVRLAQLVGWNLGP